MRLRARSLAVAALLLASGALPAAAETAPQAPKPRVMIVLDASGSMRAMLDGKTRIALAREALAELLKAWDPGVELGLVVYGHRRRADCRDIEVMVPPARPDVARILSIANGIEPQGMTPLSDAVRGAAEALKYTEQRATVILISDGQENCRADPCAVGRELKGKGIDFRAHVIGFAVTRSEEAGLRCLAETTGGRYFPARDAKGLRRALDEAGRAAQRPEATPPPAPSPPSPPQGADPPATVSAPPRVPASKSFEVRWTGGNRESDQIVIARSDDEASGSIDGAPTKDGNPIALSAPDRGGAYEVRYVTSLGRILARQRIEVVQATATIAAPASATAGATVAVAWTGPNDGDDFITIVQYTAEERAYTTYAYTRDGSPASLRLPEEPGHYELRYVTGRQRVVLARATIAVVAATATLEAPAEAVAGSKVEIAFTGPANPSDFITIVSASDPDNAYRDYQNADAGSPARLSVPSAPGEYEIRYVTGQTNRVLARRKIVSRAASVALEAPASAPVGTEIEIRWTGPNNEKDYITIVKTDAGEGAYEDYKYTSDGNPLRLRVSPRPGAYEIRYNNDRDKTVLARRALTVVDVTAVLEAPARAKTGETIDIKWTGPAGPTDYITIVKPDAAEGQYTNWFWVRDGNPRPLAMPAEPGNYELRYVIEAGPRTIGRRPIVVE